ncbi:unnamed protein product [Heterobilharzia americana]|nr:unnamed protein product [Heterobilharzia americana]
MPEHISSSSSSFAPTDCSQTNSCSVSNSTNVENYETSLHRTAGFVIQSVLLVFIIIGNSSVLIWALKNVHKSRLNRFVINLAIADLFVGLGNLIPDIVWKTTVKFYGPTCLCKVTKYLMNTSVMSSTYALLSLSIDRCIAIKWPFSRIYDQDRYTVMLCSLGWIFAMIFNIPSLVFFDINILPQFGRQCWITWSSGTWKLYLVIMSLLIFFIPVVLIILTHITIVRTIWKVRNSVLRYHVHTPRTSQSNIHVEDRRPREIHFEEKIGLSRAFKSCGEPHDCFQQESVSNKKTEMKSMNFEVLSSDTPISIRQNSCELSKANLVVSKKCTHLEFTDNKLEHHSVLSRAKMKSIQLTFLIVAVFIVCWLPYVVWNYVMTFGGRKMTSSIMYTSIVFNQLVNLNAAADPIVFWLFHVRRSGSRRSCPCSKRPPATVVLKS